jgi:hypothetical protein
MNFEDVLTPPRTSNATDYETEDNPDNLDEMTDGDRQLTTDSDAIDGGMNDSDLGSPRTDGFNGDVMTEEESDIGTAGPATI